MNWTTTFQLKGDSGGPLVQFMSGGKVTQVGIVSYGRLCKHVQERISGYTDVRNYIDWIESKTGLRP